MKALRTLTALALLLTVSLALASVHRQPQWKLYASDTVGIENYTLRGAQTGSEHDDFALRLSRFGIEIGHSIRQASADFSGAQIAEDGSVTGTVEFETVVVAEGLRSYAWVTYEREKGEAATLEVRVPGLNIYVKSMPDDLHLSAW